MVPHFTSFLPCPSISHKVIGEREMGNCQAIDNATLVIQHPCGREDKLYWPVTASKVMKMNPGHYVALLLTTTTLRSSSSSTTSTTTPIPHYSNNSVRITRIKLLRPTDTLNLGQVYRLITTQEVVKGLWAKKYAKMKKKQSESADNQERMKEKQDSDFHTEPTRSEIEKTNQMPKQERHRPRTAPTANSAAAKLRAWQPSLQSISEATS